MIRFCIRMFPFMVLLAVWACEDPKPAVTGRLNGPTDIALFKGCPENFPSCDRTTTEAKHLLLITNALEDAVRIFNVEDRRFFQADNPLFPLSIHVGRHPRSLVIEPFAEFAFVVNGISEDVSVIDLAPDHMVEVDTDWNSCSSFCGNCRDPETGDPVLPDGPQDDRCVAGVSRVALGTAENLQPEDIVAPAGTLVQATQTIYDDLGNPIGEELLFDIDGNPVMVLEKSWDRTQPLPVFVSLPGSGQVAYLEFIYPGYGPNYAQRMDLIEVLDVGGRPSGMAMTQDGLTVFVADEGSDSIVVIDKDPVSVVLSVSQIDVGGPSRRVALTPDGSTLYVVRLDDGWISLVDVATRTRMRRGEAPQDAEDPNGRDSGDLWLPSIPRSVAFVQGVGRSVVDESTLGAKAYTTELLFNAELNEILFLDPSFEEDLVKTFAYVSDMDGYVYIIDAENHRVVDLDPFTPASLSAQPALVINGEQPEEGVLDACQDIPGGGENTCMYPHLEGYPTAWAPEVNCEGVRATCSGRGVNYQYVCKDGEDECEVSELCLQQDPPLRLDENGVPYCECADGYHPVGRECIPEGQEEIWHNFYGIEVRSGVTRDEGWIFTWEGALPGTNQSSSGRVFSWRLEDDRIGLDLLKAGAQAGDILQILSDPDDAWNPGSNPCRRGSGADEADGVKKEYEIVAVEQNALDLVPVDGIDLAACWPEAIRYQVRVKGAWMVWGTESGPQPRLTMVPHEAGVVFDPPAYQNEYIRLTMYEPGIDNSDPENPKPYTIARDTSWGFNTNDGFVTTKFAPAARAGVAGELVAVDLDDDLEAGIPGDDRVYVIFEGSNAMIEFFPENLDGSNFLLYQ